MEEFKVSGSKLMAKLKELIHEGNVRRVVLKNPDGRVLLDMPLNAGIAGAALLPFWAAVGAVAVLATDYSVLIERDPESQVKKAT
jgi:streptomycin 6-kinase